MLTISFCLVISAVCLICASGFQLTTRSATPKYTLRTSPLKMIEFEANAATYAAIFAVTAIPSLAFVKFVGDSADNSRADISEDTKRRFKKSMMEQPGVNLSLQTSEEESLKRQIAEAYRQDKDVDVAILEEKLKLRAKWRKEMLAKQSGATGVDEDGW